MEVQFQALAMLLTVSMGVEKLTRANSGFIVAFTKASAHKLYRLLALRRGLDTIYGDRDGVACHLYGETGTQLPGGVAAFQEFAAYEFGDFVSMLLINVGKGQSWPTQFLPMLSVELLRLLLREHRGNLRFALCSAGIRCKLLLQGFERLLGGLPEELISAILAVEAIE